MPVKYQVAPAAPPYPQGQTDIVSDPKWSEDLTVAGAEVELSRRGLAQHPDRTTSAGKITELVEVLNQVLDLKEPLGAVGRDSLADRTRYEAGGWVGRRPTPS